MSESDDSAEFVQAAPPEMTEEEIIAENDRRIQVFGHECFDKGFDAALEVALHALAEETHRVDPDNTSDKVKDVLVNVLARTIPKHRTKGTLILSGLSSDIITPTSARGIRLLALGWRVHAEEHRWMVKVDA